MSECWNCNHMFSGCRRHGPDPLTILDYQDGQRLFKRETTGVNWVSLTSPAKQSWALRARAARATRLARFIVLGTTGGTQEILAASMADALDSTYIQADRILSITRVQ